MSSAVILMIPSSVSSSSEKRWLKALDQPWVGLVMRLCVRIASTAPGLSSPDRSTSRGSISSDSCLPHRLRRRRPGFEPVGVGLDELDRVVAPIAGVVALVLYLRVDGGVLQHFLLVAFEHLLTLGVELELATLCRQYNLPGC